MAALGKLPNLKKNESESMFNFVDAIRASIPHASTESHLPALHGIRLHNGTAWASDRYTAIRAEYDAEYMDEHDIFIPLPVAKLIIAAKSPGASIVLADEGESATIRLQNGQTFEVPETSPEAPNLARLFDQHESGTVADMALASKNLEKFAAKHYPHKNAASRRAHSIRFDFGADSHKPVKVTFAEFPNVAGLIVPIRVS